MKPYLRSWCIILLIFLSTREIALSQTTMLLQQLNQKNSYVDNYNFYKSQTYTRSYTKKIKNKLYVVNEHGIYKRKGCRYSLTKSNSTHSSKKLFIRPRKGAYNTFKDLIFRRKLYLKTVDSVTYALGAKALLDSIQRHQDRNIMDSLKIVQYKEKLKREKLKAVIIVGPVDQYTGKFIQEQRVTAQLLRSMGIQVVELYSPEATKQKVKQASKDADLFIYAGHGVPISSRIVNGGIFLNDGFFLNSEISVGLHLREGAIVIFNHACFAAGESASDSLPITEQEAIRRINAYSTAFFSAGATFYYADNHFGASKDFFQYLFSDSVIDFITKMTHEYHPITATTDSTGNQIKGQMYLKPFLRQKRTLDDEKKTKITITPVYCSTIVFKEQELSLYRFRP